VLGSYAPPGSDQVFSLNGSWQLSWDDEVGSELTGEIKTCELRLRAVDGHLSGNFVGLVAGTERDAIITGTLTELPGGGVLHLEQRESGYLCSYQIGWPAGGHLTQAVGVWHDTKGRSGNFSVLKQQ
jgi:hypothetical protein